MRPKKQANGKAQHKGQAPFTRDRLERALFLAAWLVLKDGPQYACLMRRLERELEKSSEPLRELEHAKSVIRELSSRPPIKKMIDANKDEFKKLIGDGFLVR
jgi:hypothetical protein